MKKILLLLPLVATIAFGCNCSSNQEVTILYTNDVHGAIDYNEAEEKVLSYATVAKMKQDLKNQGKNVLLFDGGDHISGGLYCTYQSGIPIIAAMNGAGYDGAIFGNHEFDYGFDQLNLVTNLARFPYISTNLYHYSPDEKKITDPYSHTRYTYNLNKVKVGVVGVTTPYAIVTSTPSHFQDDDGNYIYSFLDGNDGQDLYQAVQKEVDILRNDEKCDYVVCLSHLGNEDQTTTFTAQHLIENTKGINLLLDGHTHAIDPGTKIKNKDQQDVLVCQTGSHFENIAKITIKNRNDIQCELIDHYDGRDEAVNKTEQNIINEIDKLFGKEIATCNIDFIAKDPGDSWAVRKRETNLGDLSSDAYYYCLNELIDEGAQCDVTTINAGGIRSDVSKRTWKLLDCRNVHTFDNNISVKVVSGADIKTYLEFATRKVNIDSEKSIEYGAFPQMQGITYTINTSVESDITVDKHENYEGGPYEKFRIFDVKIYNKVNRQYENLELNKSYKIGGSSYVIEEGGDGCTMFTKKEQELVYRNSSYVDYQVLAAYIESFSYSSNGDLPIISSDTSPLKQYDKLLINYENHDGSERIKII
ncbi:MAG: 5'-nucleotidase C-terminal domain-containing protein [Bacilli bacterium]|nr:5'-nucleotidase C-terminal domain-containing protein [Bacilli bacterium]